jgi:hypothetical protein
MKKSQLLFTTFFLSFSLNSFSQLSLTAAQVNPQNNDNFIIHYAPYISPGSSGINQVWNMSSLDNSSVIVRKAYKSSANKICADQCYRPTNTELWITGTYIPVNNLWLENNEGEEMLLKYPLTYGSNYSSTWGGSDYQESVHMSAYHGGTTIAVADGVGTLMLPTGTFSNVIRVHFSRQYWMYIGTSPGNGAPGYIEDIYSWYSAEQHLEVAKVYSFSTGSPFHDKKWTSYTEFVPDPVGLQENSENQKIKVFPIPANEAITVHDENDLIVHITLTDLSGRMIYESDSVVNSSINLSDLPAAIYTLVIHKKDGSYESFKVPVIR